MASQFAPTAHVGTAALGCPVERSSTRFVSWDYPTETLPLNPLPLTFFL
jgi:hypothetical protein